MKKHNHRYLCRACHNTFDKGSIIQTDNDKHKELSERCPACASWNYYLANLTITEVCQSHFSISYLSASGEITLFSSNNRTVVQKAINRIRNLKWDVFRKVLKDAAREVQAYLDGKPCLMNNYQPWNLVFTAGGD